MTYRLIATYEPADGYSNAGSEQLSAWFASPVLEDLFGQDGLTRFDVLVPDAGKARLFDDGPAPAAVVHITAATAEPLTELVRSGSFREAFWRGPKAVAEVSPDFEMYRVIATQIDQTSDPHDRRASLSFVVRYFDPISEPDRFRDFYVANHPPILARFPEVRNVFCYLPVDVDLGDLPAAGVALGNEVVFDDLAALDTALASGVMADLREDAGNFPPFGRSSHHPMLRRQNFTPS